MSWGGWVGAGCSLQWCFVVFCFVMLFQLAFGANVFGSVVLCVGVSACARIVLGVVVASGREFLSCMMIFRVLCRVLSAGLWVCWNS